MNAVEGWESPAYWQRQLKIDYIHAAWLVTTIRDSLISEREEAAKERDEYWQAQEMGVAIDCGEHEKAAYQRGREDAVGYIKSHAEVETDDKGTPTGLLYIEDSDLEAARSRPTPLTDAEDWNRISTQRDILKGDSSTP